MSEGSGVVPTDAMVPAPPTEMGIFDDIKRQIQEAGRRLHARHTSDAMRVMIGRRRYRTSNWSLGGFKLEGCALALSAEDQVRGRIAFKGMAPGEFVAEVTHVGKAGEVGFRFLELSPHLLLSMHRGYAD